MGRKKRSAATSDKAEEVNKKARTETGESFLVKKYRAEKMFQAMEAFVKYTKSHRMLDASYVRWKIGVTPEKPFVFSTRVGGTDLGWGKGKTRDMAIDNACRAAFALVAAHGYNNFDLNDDCLLEAPVDMPPPPPPPLPGQIISGGPLPLGLPPLPGQVPSMPTGVPMPLVGTPFPSGGLLPPPIGLPPLPLGAPPITPQSLPSADLIPQPQLVPGTAPVASSLSTFDPSAPMTSGAPVSLSLSQASTSNGAVLKAKTKLKGGLTLIYDPEGEKDNEISMEELRAALPRYQKLLLRALEKQ